MAVVNNSYQILLKVNNAEISPFSVSFSVRDNIFMQLPELIFTVSDNSMTYQEYGAFFEAEKIDLLFKYDNELIQIQNKFTVSNSDVLQVDNPVNFGGKLDVNCIHNWFDKQVIQSLAYDGTVSSVVQQIVSQVFIRLTIENTTTSGVFYQALTNDIDFINIELKKRASSPQTLNSPFTSFVDNHGTYNFRSIQNLSTQTPLRLHTAYRTNQNNRYLIEKIIKKGTPSKITKNKRSRKVYIENTKLGLYEEDIDFITDYPTSTSNLPIIDEGLKSIVTDYQISGKFNGENIIEKELLDSTRNYSMIDSFILERLVLSLSFVPELVAGKTIIFDVEFEEKNSLYYSGVWIVEESVHFWNHETNRATTRIVVFRKDVNSFPATYTNFSRLLKG